MDKVSDKEQKRSQTVWDRIIYFFPIQLLVLHFKKNHFLLVFWFLLFGYVSGNLAAKYGVNYLFLYPEYLGAVGFWSYFLIGFALGGFVMAFNIYTYITHAFRFRFLATLSRPFYKFCLNNFLLPAIFIIYYLVMAIDFQSKIEFESLQDIIVNTLGFILGIGICITASLLYFYGTNKDVLGFLKALDVKKEKGRFEMLYDRFMRERVKQSQKDWSQRPWKVESYFRSPVMIVRARQSAHYDEETLRKVFKQNHFNASLFEVLLLVTFLVVMNFGELPLFTIPGGASVILFFTLLLMIMSILLSWFRGWAISIFIGLILGAGLFSDNLAFLPKENSLYGLDYSIERPEYNAKALERISQNKKNLATDQAAMSDILMRWKEKQPNQTRPKLLIINCSGGGLRSALWTTTVMTELDSMLGGTLMDRTALITGASGGMIGAAYVRDEYMQHAYQNLYELADKMKTNVSKDVLNPILLSIASSDVFFQLDNFEYGGFKYPKDRAYRFEKQLIHNLDQALDRPLSAYRQAETAADIPMIMLYPTIINDGRKMLISPLDLAFMTDLPGVEDEEISHQHELVEFRKLLGANYADRVRFMSAIRASATFPYILPQVSIPTTPPIQLMDAGIRDNFGSTISYRFISAMRSWIQANTSGVVIVQLRDKRKDIAESSNSQNLLNRLTSPVGNVYGNFMKSQDFVSDELFASTKNWLQVPLHTIDLQMEQPGDKNISMSWHLTALEKLIIEQSVNNPENQRSLQRIMELIDSSTH